MLRYHQFKHGHVPNTERSTCWRNKRHFHPRYAPTGISDAGTIAKLSMIGCIDGDMLEGVNTDIYLDARMELLNTQPSTLEKSESMQEYVFIGDRIAAWLFPP